MADSKKSKNGTPAAKRGAPSAKNGAPASKKGRAQVTSSSNAPFTVPGIDTADGHHVGELLQMRLHALNDLQLTLKHAHWNVVGRDFIGVHEMLDPQIELVRGYADEVAERMATLGVSPNGLPGALVAARSWDDYAIARATTTQHLAALDLVYTGLIAAQREAMDEIEPLDVVTHDMLLGQVSELEKFQWFMRSHLENAGGALVSGDATHELDAAARAGTA